MNDTFKKWFRSGPGPISLDELQDRTDEIQRALEAGRSEEATRLAESLVESVYPPVVTKTWRLVALCRLMRGDSAGADEACERARETASHPTDTVDAVFMQSRVRLDSHGPVAALGLLDEVLEALPNEPKLWQARAFCLSVAGRPHEALDSLDEALAVGGDEHSDASYRCEILAELGRAKEALDCLEAWKSGNPATGDPLGSLYHEAYVLARLGRPEAEHLVRTLVAVDPDHVRVKAILNLPAPGGGVWREHLDRPGGDQ